jgi:hypothetical protein
MNKLAILQSARVAELAERAAVVATLCRPPTVVELPHNSRRDERDRRRLLMLLARERRRNASLAKLIGD